MSEKQHRDKIAALKKVQATEESKLVAARTAAAKHRSDAARYRGRTTRRSTEATARSNEQLAKSADDKAAREDGKVKAASKKLAKIAADLAAAETSLDRAMKETARRQTQDDKSRRQAELQHAREVARVSQPKVVHETRLVAPAKPEILRVLYITSNPHPFDPKRTLRVDVEVRQVQQAIRAALHRDQVRIEHRPAATPEDLLDGLNDIRPHVVHFSGHAGDSTLAFENASVDQPASRDLTYALLARALAATDSPPTLLVLNGCDTLEGVNVFHPVTPVVVAMASTITDLAAATFASRFYGAIAAAQPVGVALDQAAVAIDMMGLAEGWKPELSARGDVDPANLVLVKVPSP